MNRISRGRFWWANTPLLTALIVVLVAIPLTATQPPPDAAAISQELDRVELLLRLGVVEKGAGQSFEDASDLLRAAREKLASAELTGEGRQRLEREIAAVEENLNLLIGLYDGRFFGVFPLVRLTIPFLIADEGFALTEQLFHSPDERPYVQQLGPFSIGSMRSSTTRCHQEYVEESSPGGLRV